MSTGNKRPPEIPLDEEAEGYIIGIVVANPSAAQHAAHHLTPQDFYRPQWVRVMDVTLQLNRLQGEERRIDLIASMANVPQREIEDAVAGRPAAWDPGNGFACRVKSAARRRRIMALASEIYNGAAIDSSDVLATAAAEILVEIDALPDPAQLEEVEPAEVPLRTIGYYKRNKEAELS